MAITAASLADGQLAATKTTMYTVPTATAVHVSQIILVNTDGSNAKTVNIYVKRAGSSSRRILDVDYSIAAKATKLVLADAIRLSAGDIIEGDCASATTVDYFITGGTEAV